MIELMLAVELNIFRHGLKHLIEDSGRMQVKFSTGSGKSAARYYLKADDLDAAIIDVGLKDLDGLECATKIHASRPRLPILMLSHSDRPQWAIRAFKSGAKGFITYDANIKEFFSAITKISKGQRHLSSELQETIAMATANGEVLNDRLGSLSKREFQVMVNLAQGKTNQEIADHYNLSVKTVDTYRSRLLHKLSIKNNVDLARFAFRNGLLYA